MPQKETENADESQEQKLPFMIIFNQSMSTLLNRISTLHSGDYSMREKLSNNDSTDTYVNNKYINCSDPYLYKCFLSLQKLCCKDTKKVYQYMRVPTRCEFLKVECSNLLNSTMKHPRSGS